MQNKKIQSGGTLALFIILLIMIAAIVSVVVLLIKSPSPGDGAYESVMSGVTTVPNTATVLPVTEKQPGSGTAVNTDVPEKTEQITTSEGGTDPGPEPDLIPPVANASDFSVAVGDSVSYKKHITVSDNEDPDPTVSVDNSAVDLDTPGEYPVIYTVSDRSGNVTVVKITLTVKPKDPPSDKDIDAYNDYQADLVLSEIITDDMNALQKAYAVYYWTKHNVKYSGDSDKSDYRIAARDGFKTRKGDCFTFFSVSKLLLDKLGIQNFDMVKLRTSTKQSRHYWSLVNVGDGWYHFDCTPFIYKESDFFMVTDAELKAWDKKYYKGHPYDPDVEGMPELASKSIQHLINYKSSTLILN